MEKLNGYFKFHVTWLDGSKTSLTQQSPTHPKQPHELEQPSWTQESSLKIQFIELDQDQNIVGMKQW